MKMFKAAIGFSKPEVIEIEVERETVDSVWIKGIKGSSRKVTQYGVICKTWEEAHAVLVKECSEELERDMRQFERSKAKLANVLNMGKPT